MYELAEFYNYCHHNDVDVFNYQNSPQVACTVRDGPYYAVIIDFSKIRTLREIRGITMHEYGHLATGALHKCSSPHQIWQQAEYRADGWGFEHYLPVEQLKSAFQKGYTEPWQLADYFDLPEITIKKALHYWTECRGVDFNIL